MTDIEQHVLNALTPHGYFSWYEIKDRIATDENFDKALLGLVATGKVESKHVTSSKFRYPIMGYRLISGATK